MDHDRALLEAVFDRAPVGMAVWTPEGRYVRINRALARINGLPVQDHIGRTPEDVLGPIAGAVREAIDRAVDTREPLIDLEVSGRLPGSEAVRHFEASYYPVVGEEGALLGVGGVVHEVTDRHLIDEERRRLLKEAVTARAHAEAAQIRAEAAQRMAEAARARMEFLAEAGRRMGRSMDVSTTLQEVAELAVPHIADWCVVTLLQAGLRLRNVAVAHVDPALVRTAHEISARFPPRHDAPRGIGKVVRTGEMDLRQEITDDELRQAAADDEHLDALRELGLRSALVVPLTTPERTIGALSFIRSEPGGFDSGDVELAKALATRAALHINNARLYTERSHIARTLQAGLLPRRLPEIPFLDVAATYEAAGDQNDVGGDFYDVFRTRDGAWTAVIGDVTGKGPEAAAVTSLARHTLRTAAGYHDDPSELLRVLNEALRADSTERFCTVLLARFKPEEGGVDAVVAAGGHPPALVRRAAGGVDEVDAPGTLLGAIDAVRFETRSVRLEPGDLMLCYTDGLVELRGRSPGFGERWLPAALDRQSSVEPATLLADLKRRAFDLQGGGPRDDIAMLALRARRPTRP